MGYETAARRMIPMEVVRREATVITHERNARLDQLRQLLRDNTGPRYFQARQVWRRVMIGLYSLPV